MRRINALIAIVLLGALCLSLCACGISRDKAVGTWSGSYEYNGNMFSVTFILLADGTYSKVTYKNGNFNSGEMGTWEVKSGDVLLHENGNMGTATRYEYKFDALVNNDHKFYKQ